MTQPTGVSPTAITPAADAAPGASAQLMADLRGRWVGEGINTLWVPTRTDPSAPSPQPKYEPVPSGPSKPLPRFVSSRTTETLVIGDVLGTVPNKGADDEFNELAAPYEGKVYDENGTLLHAESGYWLATPATATPPATASVAKLSSIPHGTVVLAQGELPNRQGGQSVIEVADAALTMPSPSPAGLSQPTGPLAPEFINNVAAYIQQRVAADRTGVLWELTLASTGTANTTFLQANAAVTSVHSTFWIGNLGIRADGQGVNRPGESGDFLA